MNNHNLKLLDGFIDEMSFNRCIFHVIKVLVTPTNVHDNLIWQRNFEINPLFLKKNR
ncbi:hypothetical protein EVA_18040 [gut metagenome]|uniref:Uncharacterized protein n=1 Tax=gut metagenome TaxID=749906 RepID=J9FFZ9_9ZZZZ